jgi:hypothetical protein
MNETRKVTLTHIHDISEYMNHSKIVSCSQGPHVNEYYILFFDEEPQRIDGMFVQSKTEKSHDYRILTIKNDIYTEVYLPKQKYNYHFVQPMGDDQIILVGARCRYYSENNFEKNGKIIDYYGVKKDEILLGDGIQTIQSTKNGTLWTGYFDEDVFGNYGWSEPVGAPGLIAWNRKGEVIYKNSSFDICDCYALNVISDDEVWFYYYTDFQLVRLYQQQHEIYNPKISGASGFLVYRNYFLFDKGYGKHSKYVLLQMKSNGGMKELCEVTLVNETGELIQSAYRDFRGDTLLIRENHLIYRLRLSDLIQTLV